MVPLERLPRSAVHEGGPVGAEVVGRALDADVEVADPQPVGAGRGGHGVGRGAGAQHRDRATRQVARERVEELVDGCVVGDRDEGQVARGHPRLRRLGRNRTAAHELGRPGGRAVPDHHSATTGQQRVRGGGADGPWFRRRSRG